MIKPQSICSRCRKPKDANCSICKRIPFEGISKDNYSFYASTRWRNYTKAYKRKHPLCVHCLAKGKTTPVDVIDHIIPILQGGDKWSSSNLQSLCHQCHNRKSATDKRP